MKKEIAIKVENLSKVFRIPHEKIDTMRGAFVSAFKKTSYEKFKALDDVSFEVKKGEFFGIVGRNGSGKSTLLKILAGIYTPDKGKIEINGRISPFLELGIGFNPELSGRDNIYLNGSVLGLSKKQIDEKFDDIVRFSELKRFIDQKLKNYSSGMKVRLAFSVSIHANRDILLMDEVLAVGDNNFQSKCLEEFNKYRDKGRTVILVTHDIDTIQRYCDRSMLIRDGRVEVVGDSEKVGNKYIYQNMSDEEKRIFKEEITRNEEKKGKAREKNKKPRNSEKKGAIIKKRKEKGEPRRGKFKKAKIMKVEFLDKRGGKKNVLQTGDDLSIRVYFKRNKKVKNLNFGIAIFNQEGNYIFGINTIIDKIEVSNYLKNNFFQVDYKSVPLREDSYYIKVGIFGENDNKIYDFIYKSKEMFKILSKSKNQGIVEINYNWK